MSERATLTLLAGAACLPLTMTLALGCSSPAPAAPRPPDAPVVPTSQAASREVARPSKPTPAFAPAQSGVCTTDYSLVDGTCVHLAFELKGEPLTRALADYKRGVAPPMLGPAIPKLRDRTPPGPLGPGALSRAVDADAGVAKDRRLAELDAMIAVAKDKLRERDESSKAKRVEDPEPPPGQVSAARVTTIVGGTPGAGAFEVTGSEDPMAARNAELSQLTQLLSSEQLQAMSGELSKLGIDPKQLEALVNQARGGEQPSP